MHRPIRGAPRTSVLLAEAVPDRSDTLFRDGVGSPGYRRRGFECEGRSACPADEARGSPFKVLLVGFGHLLGQGGGLPLSIASEMTGHFTALEEDLH